MYRGAAVSWSSKKLKIVCQSTTEAETAQASIAAREVYFIRSLLTEIGLAPSGPTPLMIDSSGTYGYTRHQGAKQRTKYFDLWVTFVRKAFQDNAIALLLVKTGSEVADALTKALPRIDVIRHRNTMMNLR